MYQSDLLYTIKPADHTPEKLRSLLEEHNEIKFVSFMGIDFAGNDTDEKVPIKLFLEDLDTMLYHHTAQTDGSSVVLPGIASLNDARVDMVADLEVNWFVDYNYEHFDADTGKMVGTLRVPCFLLHNGVFVDSRHILKDTLRHVKKEVLDIIKTHDNIPGLEHIKKEDAEEVVFTCATELEFWVKSPTEDVPIEALSSSQMMQEQYWQRTRGNVRTALEQAVEALAMYGLEPEMGHKECGGVRGQMDMNGHMTHVMEQLELDWKFSSGMQTADNEILARIVVKEIFRMNGLEVSFLAKPILGVAGSGEHTHVGMALKLKNGKIVNLMSPKDMTQDFLSAIGFGTMMGLLKNYEVCNPFISATMDSFRRLKPGFEAPVCIVTSLGIAPTIPSRNRTVLAGLIRDMDNPKATRIEMRSPNPFTNTYMALTVFYLSALDGIKAAIASGKDLKGLEKELSKKHGEEGFYLEKDREYRTESDVFEDFTPEQRDQLFGKPPATVWENMQAIKKYPDKVHVLTEGGILKPEFINSFLEGAMIRWRTELVSHFIPDCRDKLKGFKPLHDLDMSNSPWDENKWQEVDKLKTEIGKNTDMGKCLFTQIEEAVAAGKYDHASNLQLQLMSKMETLEKLYHAYASNIL
jgi:glutamine synthetase